MLTSTPSQLKPEFFDVFLDLAEEFRLPLRLPDASAQRLAGFPFRELAAERGVVSPDRVILTGGRRLGPRLGASGRRADARARRRGLEPTTEGGAQLAGCWQPGVTEVCLRPALDTLELRAAAPDWQERTADRGLLLGGAALAEAAGAAT